jgi:hypothetical protein
MGTPPDDDEEGWDDGTAVAGPGYIDAITKKPEEPDFEGESGTAVAGVDYVENILKTVEPAPLATVATIPRAPGLAQPRAPTMAFGTPALLRAPAGSPTTPAAGTPIVDPTPDPTKKTLPLGSSSLGAIPSIRVPAKLPGMPPPKPARISDSMPTVTAKSVPGMRASSPVIARQSSPAIARERPLALARASSPASAAIARDKTPAPAPSAPAPAPAAAPADVDVDMDMDAPSAIVAASAAIVPDAPVVPAYDDREEDDLEAFDNAATVGPGTVEMPALARAPTPAPSRPTPLPIGPTPLPQQVPKTPNDYAHSPTLQHVVAAQPAPGMHAPAGYVPTPMTRPPPAVGFAAPLSAQARPYSQINGQYPLAAGAPYTQEAAASPSLRRSHRPLVLIGAVLASVAVGIGVYFVALDGRGGAKKPAAGATAGDAAKPDPTTTPEMRDTRDTRDPPQTNERAATGESSEPDAPKPDTKPEVKPATTNAEPATKPAAKPAAKPAPKTKPAPKPAPRPAPRKPAPKKPAAKKPCSGLDCL